MCILLCSPITSINLNVQKRGGGGLKNSGHDHEAALSGSWVECSADFSGCKVWWLWDCNNGIIGKWSLLWVHLVTLHFLRSTKHSFWVQTKLCWDHGLNVYHHMMSDIIFLVMLLIMHWGLISVVVVIIIRVNDLCKLQACLSNHWR